METIHNTATPFSGSKIQLISKLEIRYEGTLHNVDPKESTITLSGVRSFGTENRIVENPIPPRDEIFQYIIFRAADIKDLIVDQPPLTDPAIIEASSRINAGQSSSSIQKLQAGIQNAPGAATSISKPSTSQQSAPVNVSAQNLQDSNKNKPSTSGAQIVASTTQASKQTNKQPQLPQRINVNPINRQHPQQNNRTQQQNDGGNGGFMGNRTNNFNRRFNVNTRSPMNGMNQRNGSQNFNNRNFANRFQSRQPTGFNSYNRRQNNRNFVSRQNAKPTISLPDFDFEKAQDEFKELEEKLANLKVNGDAPEAVEPASVKTEIEVSKDPCYNKEKSFFDKISCEALERERGNVQRVDWKAERKLNRETFGVMAPMRRNNGYRPNNRFGGGGYRGYQNYRSRSGQRTPNQSAGGGNANKQQPNGLTNTAIAASGPSTSNAVSIVAASSLVSPAKN